MGEILKTGLGRRIYDLREDHNETQKSFGEKFGVSISTVQRWEAGASIDSESLLKISNEYKKSIDWLVTGAGTENLEFCNSTGLTEKTIEAFRRVPAADAINELMEDPIIGYAILEQINSILKKRYVDLYDSRGQEIDSEHEKSFAIVTLIRLLDWHGRDSR